MPFPLHRSAVVAVALAAGLVALPACKKTKPTEAPPSTPAPNPTPNPNPGPGTVITPPPGGDASLPAAPKGPFFRGPTPLGAGVRSAAEQNMKQIMLGLHGFESATGAFPAGYADKTSKPGLSWRVAVLPYIEQDNLFKQFKLDEPWDSPSNKKLIELMPKQFAPPGQTTRGWTYLRGFAAANTGLYPVQTGAPGAMLLGARIGQFTDGLSNTILVAEAADPVIWTRPEETPFAPNAAPKLGGVFESGIVVGLGDGSTKFLPRTTSAKTLAAAIQINDGEVVDWSK